MNLAKSTVKKITLAANAIREAHPEIYGDKGARPGTPGYVKDGWKAAQRAATEQYYREMGKQP